MVIWICKIWKRTDMRTDMRMKWAKNWERNPHKSWPNGRILANDCNYACQMRLSFFICLSRPEFHSSISSRLISSHLFFFFHFGFFFDWFFLLVLLCIKAGATKNEYLFLFIFITGERSSTHVLLSLNIVDEISELIFISSDQNHLWESMNSRKTILCLPIATRRNIPSRPNMFHERWWSGC